MTESTHLSPMWNAYRVACEECDEPAAVELGKASAVSRAESHHDATGHPVRVTAIGTRGEVVVGDD